MSWGLDMMGGIRTGSIWGREIISFRVKGIGDRDSLRIRMQRKINLESIRDRLKD